METFVIIVAILSGLFVLAVVWLICCGISSWLLEDWAHYKYAPIIVGTTIFILLSVICTYSYADTGI